MSKLLAFVKEIKDPIWGQIPITNIERKIIESKPFVRLRHVRQMSMAYFTYIGANHTRYEHSLGTMHVAYRIADNIPKIKNFFNEESTLKIHWSKYDIAIQLLRLAALLHDVGHPPYSHAVEWTFKKNPHLSPFQGYSHDEYTKKIIKNNTDIEKIIKEHVNLINNNYKDIGSSFEINGHEYQSVLAALVAGEEDTISSQRNIFLRKLTFLVPILNGDLDADKIDYILRDNYHCGFPTGVDFDKIVKAFDLFQENSDSSKLLLKKEYISTVETLLHTRLRLMDLIHHERTNRIANQMLMRYVAAILENKEGSEREDIVTKMHEEWTDNEMYNFISTESDENPPFKKLFEEPVLSYDIKLDLYTFSPIVRRFLYIISKNPKYLLKMRKDLEEEFEEEIHLDLCFIDPPPLTLQILDDSRFQNPYLYDASDIIKAILWESFYRSFVGIYSNVKKLEIESSEIKDKFIHLTKKIGRDLINDLHANQKITCGELIICVLAGIDKFVNEKLDRLPVWLYSISEFQEFLNFLTKNNFNYELDDFKKIEKKYNPNFYREVMQLVFCGLISQCKREMLYHDTYYTQRLDHRIKSPGKIYHEKYLKPLYNEISDTVFKYEVNVEDCIDKSIKICLTVDKSDKEDYNNFVKQIRKYKTDIKNGGGCLLVL